MDNDYVICLGGQLAPAALLHVAVLCDILSATYKSISQNTKVPNHPWPKTVVDET